MTQLHTHRYLTGHRRRRSWDAPRRLPFVTVNFQLVLMPAVFTTLRHFSMSARRYLSNSAGVMLIGTAPCLAQAAFVSGLDRALLISAVSTSTIGLGVPSVAMIPSQMVAA